MSFTRSDLKEMDKLWKQAASDGGGGGEGSVPEGKYQAEIIGAELHKSASGRPQCKFTYKIVGGSDDVVGQEITTYDGLETPSNLKFFVKKLKRLKASMPSSFEDLPETLQGVIGVVAQIQVKVNGEFTNVYVNGFVSAASGTKKTKQAEASDEAEESADESTEESTEETTPKESDEETPEEETTPEPADDEEEQGENASARSYPTQEKIDKLNRKELDKILTEFKVKSKAERKDSTCRAVAKVLVAIMEDDSIELQEIDMKTTLTLLGEKPVDGGPRKLRTQLIRKLGG